MKVKVFYPKPNGKIEFTREQLEKLLSEVYDEGYKDGDTAGYNRGYNTRPFTWTGTPSWYGSGTTITSETSPYVTTESSTTINTNATGVELK